MLQQLEIIIHGSDCIINILTKLKLNLSPSHLPLSKIPQMPVATASPLHQCGRGQVSGKRSLLQHTAIKISYILCLKKYAHIKVCVNQCLAIETEPVGDIQQEGDYKAQIYMVVVSLKSLGQAGTFRHETAVEVKFLLHQGYLSTALKAFNR